MQIGDPPVAHHVQGDRAVEARFHGDPLTALFAGPKL
jgi:hypothetical protein